MAVRPSAPRALAGRHRTALWVALGVVLVFVGTFAYSSATNNTHTATVRLQMFVGTADALFPISPVSRTELQHDSRLLRSFLAAEGAAKQLPTPPPDKPALLATAHALQRKVTISVDHASGTLLIRSRAGDAAQAARVANAYAGSLLALQGAASVGFITQAVEVVAHRVAALPSRNAARRVATTQLTRTLAPLVAQRQVQIVRSASAGNRPVRAATVAAALTLLALIGILVAAGVPPPRPEMT